MTFTTAERFASAYWDALQASMGDTSTWIDNFLADPVGAALAPALQFDGFIIGANPYLAPGDHLADQVPPELPTGCPFPCAPFDFPDGGAAALQDPFAGPSLIAGPLYYDNVALNDVLVQGLGLNSVYDFFTNVEHLGISLFQAQAVVTLGVISAAHELQDGNFSEAIGAVDQAFFGSPVSDDVPEGSALNEGAIQTVLTALSYFGSADLPEV